MGSEHQWSRKMQKPQSVFPDPVQTSLFCPFASVSLLVYLGAYTFLGWFNPLLGRYQILGELLHLGMVSVPIGSMITVLTPSALICYVLQLFPAGWVPDILIKCDNLTQELVHEIIKYLIIAQKVMLNDELFGLRKTYGVQSYEEARTITPVVIMSHILPLIIACEQEVIFHKYITPPS
ncbi:hypothetical protein DSO57_1021916 [Entomophthora muscae]|uniref:Uncharacterized protein n=1 Tax=Entomophthora muscae TaxID=34485 RepID=A0ACC2SS43_9FUNG|nr:hypothetical protein DSO57_1021916 [Entomophthora muscae]